MTPTRHDGCSKKIHAIWTVHNRCGNGIVKGFRIGCQATNPHHGVSQSDVGVRGKRTHRFTVWVTDGRDQNGDDDMDAIDDTISVNVNVTNVNEVPVVTGNASVSF